MTNRQKSKAIFEAMEKYGDYFIFVTLKHGSCVVCHAVSMKHVFVSHYCEPNALQVWFEDIKDVVGCYAYKKTKWTEEEIKVF